MSIIGCWEQGESPRFSGIHTVSPGDISRLFIHVLSAIPGMDPAMEQPKKEKSDFMPAEINTSYRAITNMLW